MANKNDKSRGINRANKTISKLADSVKNNMDYLYRSTYMSSSQQSDDIKRISADINRNLDKIVNKNMELFGKPNMSNLYSRMALDNNSNSDELVKDMTKIVLKENEQYIGKEVTKEAIERVDGKAKSTKEGGKANDKEEKKRTRRTTKTKANANA